MKFGYGCLHYCHSLRRKGASLRNVLPAAATTGTSVASGVSGRHIASFKGQPQDFLTEVGREKAVLVYFYTSWCKPCDGVNVKLEALWTEGLTGLSDGAEITSSSSTTLENSFSSSSSFSAAEKASEAPTPSLSCSASGPQNDSNVVLNSTCEMSLQVRTLGKIVRVIPIDTDLNPKLGALHDVRSVPTFITYRDGHIVGRVEGSNWEEVWRLVKELLREGDTQPSTGGKGAPAS